jgi:hypothetical protein
MLPNVFLPSWFLVLHYFPIPWCPWIIKKNSCARVHWESQRLNKKWNEIIKMNIEMNPYSSHFTIALEPSEFATTQLHRKNSLEMPIF